jgi:hypothetical protein
MDSGSRGCAVVRSECVGFRKAYELKKTKKSLYLLIVKI